MIHKKTLAEKHKNAIQLFYPLWAAIKTNSCSITLTSTRDYKREKACNLSRQICFGETKKLQLSIFENIYACKFIRNSNISELLNKHYKIGLIKIHDLN